MAGCVPHPGTEGWLLALRLQLQSVPSHALLSPALALRGALLPGGQPLLWAPAQARLLACVVSQGAAYHSTSCLLDEACSYSLGSCPQGHCVHGAGRTQGGSRRGWSRHTCEGTQAFGARITRAAEGDHVAHHLASRLCREVWRVLEFSGRQRCLKSCAAEPARSPVSPTRGHAPTQPTWSCPRPAPAASSVQTAVSCLSPASEAAAVSGLGHVCAYRAAVGWHRERQSCVWGRALQQSLLLGGGLKPACFGP